MTAHFLFEPLKLSITLSDADVKAVYDHTVAVHAAGLAEGRKEPDGWKLVPRVATEEMRQAMLGHWHLRDGTVQEALESLLSVVQEPSHD